VADLTPGSRRDSNRGQLLLIGAFIIAVSFVVLALIVNSAIFTENLATRDEVAGSGDALEYRQEVTQSGGDVLTEINQNNSIDTADQQDKLKNNLGHIDIQGGLQQSAQGRIVEVENDSVVIETGIKVAQDTEKPFSNTTATSDFPATVTDWVVVENVTTTRNLRMNITDLNSLSSPSGASPFELEIENSSASWNMSIIYNDTADLVNITVESPNHGSPEVCTRTATDYIKIDVTRAMVGREPCHALSQTTDGTEMWFGLEDEYDIKFNNYDNIEGTYSFIIDVGDFNEDNFGDGGSNPDNSDHDPYYRDAIYNATVPFKYHTADVGYETEIEIAPGEVPP
jgi:hypothetical protein